VPAEEETKGPEMEEPPAHNSANIYIEYFKHQPDEKLLDTWFRVHLPALRESGFRSNKRLKKEIVNGIPVPMRGQTWQLLVGNSLRISPLLFQVLSESPDVVALNPLIDEDIPRTFPHLNELFVEIDSLVSSLRQILRAYSNFRPDIGYV